VYILSLGHVERFKSERPIIIVHGGAGAWDVDEDTRRRITDFIEKLLVESYELLMKGSEAVDVVEYAVSKLEDSGIFNAGYGSSLNIKGVAEMDAGIMIGSVMKAGAVAMSRYVKNPIKLARIVMEKTDHVLIGGEGADELAKLFGLEKREINESIYRRYKDALNKKILPPYYRKNLEIIDRVISLRDTVGAVALDIYGTLASATSTGGIWFKLPGRIGDSPIPGAGFYADRNVACSATGVGETIMTISLCRSIALSYRYLNDLYKATVESFRELEELFGGNTAGAIILSSLGEIIMYYNTKGMARGFMSSSLSKPYVNI
jgi:beta-aspartyl-peptidase (threonine type)